MANTQVHNHQSQSSHPLLQQLEGLNILPQSSFIIATSKLNLVENTAYRYFLMGLRGPPFASLFFWIFKALAWEDLQAAEPCPSCPSFCHWTPLLHSLLLQPVQLLKRHQGLLAGRVETLLFNTKKFTNVSFFPQKILHIKS